MFKAIPYLVDVPHLSKKAAEQMEDEWAYTRNHGRDTALHLFVDLKVLGR